MGSTDLGCRQVLAIVQRCHKLLPVVSGRGDQWLSKAWAPRRGNSTRAGMEIPADRDLAREQRQPPRGAGTPEERPCIGGGRLKRSLMAAKRAQPAGKRRVQAAHEPCACAGIMVLDRAIQLAGEGVLWRHRCTSRADCLADRRAEHRAFLRYTRGRRTQMRSSIAHKAQVVVERVSPRASAAAALTDGAARKAQVVVERVSPAAHSACQSGGMGPYARVPMP